MSDSLHQCDVECVCKRGVTSSVTAFASSCVRLHEKGKRNRLTVVQNVQICQAQCFHGCFLNNDSQGNVLFFETVLGT